MKTDEEVLRELDKTRLFREGGSCFECCDFEGICSDMQFFITSLRSSDRKEILEEIRKMKENLLPVASRLQHGSLQHRSIIKSKRINMKYIPIIVIVLSVLQLLVSVYEHDILEAMGSFNVALWAFLYLTK